MDEYVIPYIIRILVLITAIIGTIQWNKYNLTSERFFLLFLWITVIIEIIASLLIYKDFEAYFIYNIYSIFSFIFYLKWFYSILKSKLTIPLFFSFLLIVLINILNQDIFKGYLELTFIFGAVIILICSFMYYSQLLKGDEIDILKKRLSFWIVTGILFFHIGMIPLFLLTDVLDFSGIYYLSVLLCLNTILYGCYIIGFLWTKKMFNR